MKNRFLTFTMGAVFMSLLSFLFISCDDDTDPIYEGYGMVNRLSNHQFAITLDDGNLIYPKEFYFNPDLYQDSTRLYMQFNILQETDSCAYVRLRYVDTILTKNIIPYDETILDSIGKDPVKISHAWFAHSFLNFEFMFAGRISQVNAYPHMVNLLQYPAENNKLIFEFRHNDFNDYRDKVYMGVVSFPIEKIIENLEKPVQMEIKFNDFENTTRSIELTYR